MPTLTIFTATYNRRNLVARLYESLLRQNNYDFEWLVIDDGSNDGTNDLFSRIQSKEHPFTIRYFQQENKGLIRSLNRGVELAKGIYLSKIDSDDFVTDDYCDKVISWINEIKGEKMIYGVGGLKVDKNMQPLSGKWPLIDTDGYVDASDIERKHYRLDADMSEAWNLQVLRQYPFKVYPGEKFAPEQITFYEIALKGYKIRWRNVPIQICEYQEGGLTLGSFNLQRNNPMGYAMMYNQLMDRNDYTIFQKLNCAIQMFSMAFVGKHPLFGFKIKHLQYRIVGFIPGLILSFRRKSQFKKE